VKASGIVELSAMRVRIKAMLEHEHQAKLKLEKIMRLGPDGDHDVQYDDKHECLSDLIYSLETIENSLGDALWEAKQWKDDP
jgi:hypothetical protein